MPAKFENAFLDGLKTGGITLPENWKHTICLLNLDSLLDLLTRSDPKIQPHQCADIKNIITHMILCLKGHIN
jgi:hypothetical protein